MILRVKIKIYSTLQAKKSVEDTLPRLFMVSSVPSSVNSRRKMDPQALNPLETTIKR